MPITVLLVDDEADVRSLARIALRVRGGFRIVGEAGDAAAALACAAQVKPEVIMLDLGLPDLAGTDLIGRIREASPRSEIVVFTGSDIGPDALAGQVAGYVRKGTDIERVVDVLAEVGASSRLEEVLELPADETSPAAARRFLRDVCERWDCEDAVDELLVVVSELVTNAVLHARSGCVVRVSRRGGAVRVDVRDRGVGSPDPQVASVDDEHGRGLYLISAMSSAWGVDPVEGGGKSIWAELVC